MSFAREKFLKRKRELLGNINILDSECKENKEKEEKENKKEKVEEKKIERKEKEKEKEKKKEKENRKEQEKKEERKKEENKYQNYQNKEGNIIKNSKWFKNEKENKTYGKKYRDEERKEKEKERDRKEKIKIKKEKEKERKEKKETWNDYDYDYDSHQHENNKGKNDIKGKKKIRNDSSNFLDGRSDYKDGKRKHKWLKYETSRDFYDQRKNNSNKKNFKESKYNNRQFNQFKINPLHNDETPHQFDENWDFIKHNRYVDIKQKEENLEGMKTYKQNQYMDIELLMNLDNTEINNSAALLIYVCKLMLHMCGKKCFDRKSIDTLFTSVEILREIKKKHKKHMKLLKINIINRILFYLFKGNDSIEEMQDSEKEECIDEEDVNILKKHTEIKIKEKCIEIGNIGISVIIKKVYVRNIINLLSSCNSFMNESYSEKKGETTIPMLTVNLNNIKKENFKYTNPSPIPVIPGMISSQSVSQPPPPPPFILPPPPPPTTNPTSFGISTTMNANTPPIKRNNMEFGFENEKEITPPDGNFANTMLFPTQDNFKKPNANQSTKEMYPNKNAAIKNKETNVKNNKINYLENLLNEPTTKEKKRKEEKTNILSILEAPTVIEEMRIKKFQKNNDSLKRICTHLAKSICQKHAKDCRKIHFKEIISEHTDVSLGDCSYLDTCRHIETCKFVHYAVDKEDQQSSCAQRDVQENNSTTGNSNNKFSIGDTLTADQGYAPQWIRCDLRNFDLSIFNQYVSVVMADPPWDIHMDLPYGTMTDNEMKHLPVQLIQDEGMIFLWVTGRAMELARECLQIWGYKKVEEILWVKTNHLQRIIRTGRTGHWLNHSKEHCLVGVKGNPILNRNIDCDVIVSEVRETSRKPDEIYSIIERLCPQNLKIELFGRPHNCRHNWITLGNQLNGVVLHHPQIKERYNRVAPQFNLPLCE